MQKRVLLVVCGAFMLSAFVVGCGRGTVAKINGRKITRQEYFARLERLPYQDPNSGQSIEAGALTLQRLISEELIVRLAEKEGVAPTEQQIKERIAQSMKAPEFAANVRASGLTKDQLRELMRVEQAAFNLQTKGAKVTAAEVKDIYDKNKDTVFTIAEQVQLQGIFTDSKPNMDKVLGLLKSGVEFGTVARTMSKHGSAKFDGRLAPLARGFKGIPESVQAIIFATARDKYTAPVSTGGGGWAVFKVLQHLPKRVQRFKDVEVGIRDNMMLQRGMRKNPNLNAELTKFREAAKIDVYIERYKKLIIPPEPAPAQKRIQGVTVPTRGNK